jgi:prepilin-type N-terminal cleavage/methylation domain-containing protein
MPKITNKSGFTLMEVLIVVAILSLITALGVTAIMTYYQSAQERVKQTHIETVESAKETWATLNNKADGTEVLWEDIADYIGRGISQKSELDVGGDSITINTIGTDASYP